FLSSSVSSFSFMLDYIPFNFYKIISIFLGLITLFLVKVILDKFLEDNETFLFLALLVFNPLFLYLFLSITPYSLSIIFSLIGVLFILNNKNVGFLFFVLAGLFDIFISAGFLIFLS